MRSRSRSRRPSNVSSSSDDKKRILHDIRTPRSTDVVAVEVVDGEFGTELVVVVVVDEDGEAGAGECAVGDCGSVGVAA